MRKFRAVLKEKQSVSNRLHEKKVLGSFKKVYNALLDKYSISNLGSLNEDHQLVFLAELNSYWDEKSGILPKGKKFLNGNSDMLNEKSTVDQKRNFMKKRVIPAISETLRQSGLKWKLYDIIDEMYKGIGADNLRDVLDAKEMTSIMVESFRESVKTFMTEVKFELSENSKPKIAKSKLFEKKFSTEERKALTKKGHAMKDGGFPIVTKKDLQNAIKAFGRGNNSKAEKAHILKRAKALKAINLIPDKWKKNKVNEGFFSKKPINLKGEYDNSITQKTAEFLIDLLNSEGIKSTVGPDGYLRNEQGKIIAGVTPTGYIDVHGFGNWSPEEMEMESHDILKSILGNIQSVNY